MVAVLPDGAEAARVPSGGASRGSADGGPRHAVVTAAVAVLLVVASGACGGGSGTTSPPRSSGPGWSTVVPATSTPVSTVDAEHARILAAYAEFLRVGTQMANRGEADGPGLAEVATGPALVQTRAAIRAHVQAGRVYAGSVRIVSSEVVGVDVVYGARRATVRACVDITDYVLVHRDDGSPVEVDRGLEVFQVVVELIFAGDRWLVLAVDDTTLREVPCGP